MGENITLYFRNKMLQLARPGPWRTLLLWKRRRSRLEIACWSLPRPALYLLADPFFLNCVPQLCFSSGVGLCSIPTHFLGFPPGQGCCAPAEQRRGGWWVVVGRCGRQWWDRCHRPRVRAQWVSAAATGGQFLPRPKTQPAETSLGCRPPVRREKVRLSRKLWDFPGSGSAPPSIPPAAEKLANPPCWWLPLVAREW